MCPISFSIFHESIYFFGWWIRKFFMKNEEDMGTFLINHSHIFQFLTKISYFLQSCFNFCNQPDSLGPKSCIKINDHQNSKPSTLSLRFFLMVMLIIFLFNMCGVGEERTLQMWISSVLWFSEIDGKSNVVFL